MGGKNDWPVLLCVCVGGGGGFLLHKLHDVEWHEVS